MVIQPCLKTTLVLMLLALCSLPVCRASAPAPMPTKKVADADKDIGEDRSRVDVNSDLGCESGLPEDAVLCEAHLRKEDTIRQVIADDDTKERSDEAPSAKHADDIWVNAFNQWLSNQKSPASSSTKAKSAERAIRVARRNQDRLREQRSKNPSNNSNSDRISSVSSASNDSAYSEAKMGTAAFAQAQRHESEKQPRNGPVNVQVESIKSESVSDTDHETVSENDFRDGRGVGNNDGSDDDDDELKLVMRAAKRLLSRTATEEQIIEALELTMDLCASGDNGRQFATSGGVSGILARVALVSKQESSLVTSLLRALASCCQNNVVVFNTATDAGAIGTISRLAEKMGDDGDNDSRNIRAAMLKLLVAVADAHNAADAFWTERKTIVNIMLLGSRIGEDDVGHNQPRLDSVSRRSLVRTFALADALLRKHARAWKDELIQAGLQSVAKRALDSNDVDVKEGAATLVRLLR